MTIPFRIVGSKTPERIARRDLLERFRLELKRNYQEGESALESAPEPNLTAAERNELEQDFERSLQDVHKQLERLIVVSQSFPYTPREDVNE